MKILNIIFIRIIQCVRCLCNHYSQLAVHAKSCVRNDINAIKCCAIYDKEECVRIANCFENMPRNEQGYYLISENRKYHHDENLYDQQYSISPFDYAAGEGVAALAKSLQLNINHAILECACGTGKLSVGLMKAFNPDQLLVTDASSIFLDIFRKKFLDNSLQLPSLGLLQFEDVDKLPDHAFSLILVRSALHHIDKYEKFIQIAAKKLVPNGALMFQEPLYEGLFLMGLIAKYLQKMTWNRKILKDLRLLSDTMRFYCKTDIDKSMAEDKHTFRLNDILIAASNAKLTLQFFPNMAFEDFVRPTKPFEYSSFIEEYLKYCMSFSEKTVSFFMKNAKDVLQYISDIAGLSRAPESSGVFVLKNNA